MAECRCTQLTYDIMLSKQLSATYWDGLWFSQSKTIILPDLSQSQTNKDRQGQGERETDFLCPLQNFTSFKVQESVLVNSVYLRGQSSSYVNFVTGSWGDHFLFQYETLRHQRSVYRHLYFYLHGKLAFSSPQDKPVSESPPFLFSNNHSGSHVQTTNSHAHTMLEVLNKFRNSEVVSQSSTDFFLFV